MSFSIFPDVLWLGTFFTPLLLRLSLGVLFTHLAILHIKNKTTVPEHIPTSALFPKNSLVLAVIAVDFFLALFLFIGLYIQLTALIGILYCLISVYKKKRSLIVPYSHSLYFLMLVVLLSLFFTGAGPLAFDIPL